MSDNPGDPKGRAEPGFERHVFVCVNERDPGHVRGCCHSKGGTALRELFKKAIVKAGLVARVRANKAGCLDFCESGPTVVVYPEGVWYHIDDPDRDVAEIVERHLVGGEVVERCVMRF